MRKPKVKRGMHAKCGKICPTVGKMQMLLSVSI